MKNKKEYPKDNITVVWEPELCFHAKACVHGLPKVFKPKEKPWIQTEGASVSALKKTIDKCPSGALSYYETSDGNKKEDENNSTQIEIMSPGPLLVKGKVTITHSDGNTEIKTKNTAFCRCGASQNQPYCDGSHHNI